MSVEPVQRTDRDPYRGVVFLLLTLAVLGAAAMLIAGLAIANPVFLDVFVAMVLASGILVGVARAQGERARALTSHRDSPTEEPLEDAVGALPAATAPAPSATPTVPAPALSTEATAGIAAVDTAIAALPKSAPTYVPRWLTRWVSRFSGGQPTATVSAVAGVVAIAFVLLLGLPAGRPSDLAAAIATGGSLLAAALAATVARYLSAVDFARFPEAPGLSWGARVMGWTFVLVAAAAVLAWGGQQTVLLALHAVVIALDFAVCYSLFVTKRKPQPEVSFPLELAVLSALGTRANVLASLLDAGQRQLGIDLRSTWALTVVRRTLEPLAIGLLVLGWLSTSLTVVGVQDQALVERFGAPVSGPPLAPGLHLHWPWPVDRVFPVPVQRVQSLSVGHEGEEENAGPENVLWAVEHAPNEYTLLLGNGRDLITIDATLEYRVKDARAWHYHCQNPEDALRAIAYRAVMRSTVDRTLAEALSENVASLTGEMRTMVQREADELGLGAEVVGFTLGGMHPPVMVAADYQAVVSAALGKVTAAVNAQADRNQSVPAAEAAVVTSANAARAAGAEGLARAAGEAWSFRTLEAQYHAGPEDYRFRRRLETLEKGLAERHFTVVDARFLRDGGELWLMP